MTLSLKTPLLTVLLFAFVLTACESEPDTTAEVPMATDSAAVTMDEDAAVTPPATATKINLNTATADEFRTIPGMGDRMIGEFEEYRPYVSIQQFRREIGKYVDEAQVAAYEEYVFVPVNPNESDAATLQQLPGVDANEAETLIAGRPYDSDAAFLEALAAYVTPEERATAEAYLATE